MAAQYPTQKPVTFIGPDGREWGEEDHRLAHERAMIAQDICEDIAKKIIPRIATLLASVCEPVWSWGDGRGGWVWEQLAAAMEDRGFEVSRERAPVPTRVERLAKRDGWDCHYCTHPLGYGHPTAVRQPIVEHVLPRSRGGRNVNDNYVLSCERCNVQKSTMTPQEWMGEPCCDRHSNDALGVAS